jgi:hypothetical protein
MGRCENTGPGRGGGSREPRQRRDNGSEFEPETVGANLWEQGAMIGTASIGDVYGNTTAGNDAGVVGKAKLVVTMSSFWTATASFS